MIERGKLGDVAAFSGISPDKSIALKPLEEAAEVFGAWQMWDLVRAPYEKDKLLDECADVIQATVNVAAALGVGDMRPYIIECERRNRERGRL